MKFVNREEIRYKNDFGREEAKKQATDRFMQARALERMEEQGWLSKAEAEMAARHSGAWAAAVNLAKERGVYAGPAGSVATDEQKTARLGAETIYTAFEDAYDTDESQAASCHGAKLFMAHRNSFPKGFNSRHLDLFLATYVEAMTFKPRSALYRLLTKTTTTRSTRPSSWRERRRAPLYTLAEYGQRVVTLANLSRLSLVAHTDDLPNAHDPQLRSESGDV